MVEKLASEDFSAAESVKGGTEEIFSCNDGKAV